MSIHPWAEEGFGRAAGGYERGRPGYPPEAVRFLVRRLALRPGATVVDLAAGTGKLARLLVPSGARVVAVEPVAEMRESIPAGIEVVAGSAEAIPLPPACADAVTAAQAFHWFRAGEALAEIHRVLRPHGALAILRNRRDPDDALQRAFAELLAGHRSHPSLEEGLDVQAALGASGLFAAAATHRFPNAQELDGDRLVALAASESSIALLDEGKRATALAEFRRLADGRPPRFRLRWTTEIVVGARASTR